MPILLSHTGSGIGTADAATGRKQEKGTLKSRQARRTVTATTGLLVVPGGPRGREHWHSGWQAQEAYKGTRKQRKQVVINLNLNMTIRTESVDSSDRHLPLTCSAHFLSDRRDAGLCWLSCAVLAH